MKIELKSQTNLRAVESLRSQIKDSGDLKKFDEFLSKHESFDFADEKAVSAAKGSCSNDNGGRSCDIIVNLPPIKL